MQSNDAPEPVIVRFNRGDRVILDLSALGDPPGEDQPESIRKSYARLMEVHGSLGTVVRGDDTRSVWERFVHRRTGQPGATIAVNWDETHDLNPRQARRRRKKRPYLAQVVYRTQLKHTDQPRPERRADDID